MRGVSLRRTLLSLGLLVAAAGATRPALPAAPTALTGQITFDTHIDLQWKDNSSNETGFVIWRRVDGGSWLLLTQTAANVVAWRDRPIAVQHNYSYRVRAINSEGASGWSNELSFTCPAAPGNFTVTAGETGIDLRWTDNSDNETAFAVWRQGTDGVWARINARPPNFVRYTDTTSGVLIANPPVRMTPLAVDRRAYALGVEVSLAFGPILNQRLWRISIPTATIDDLEWMLRDGVENLACKGDWLRLDPNTGAIEGSIQAAVAQLVALSQGDPTFQADTLLSFHRENPRIIRLPVIDAGTGRVVSVAEFWLTGATASAIKGYFLSQKSAPGPNIRYRVRAINNVGASPYTPEVVFPGSVVTGTVPLF
jgi:hypothetical protein